MIEAQSILSLKAKFYNLGFTDNSLQVYQIMADNDGVPIGSFPFRYNDLGKLPPDFIEIKLDRVNNRIMFEYMFGSGHVDLNIRFKVVLKNQFQMSMVNSRNFTFHAESRQYHENGLRTEKVEMVDKLTEGYDGTTLEAHFSQDSIFFTSGNRFAGRAQGSLAGSPHVSSDWNPISDMKRYMDWGQNNIIGPNMKRLNLKENELARQKVLLYIEYMSHPPFLIIIDKARTVMNLKQMMEKTLNLYNFLPPNARQMRLVYNGQIQDDKSKLIEVLKADAREARMTMVPLLEMSEEHRQAN